MSQSLPATDQQQRKHLDSANNNGSHNSGETSIPDSVAKLSIYPRCSSRLSGKRFKESWLAENIAKLKLYADSNPAFVNTELYQKLLTLEKQDAGAAAAPVGDLARTVSDIAGLAKSDASVKKIIRQSGGLAMVVYLMTSFCGKDLGIQIAGCELLTAVSEDVNAIQEEIGAVEGVDAVLDCMSAQPDAADLQMSAARALRSLAWGLGNRQTMIRHGAVQDMVAAMHAHPANASLQEHIASTVAQVVYGSSEMKALVGTAGGVKAILTAMRSHSKNSNLQGQCCFAIRNLSWESPENHSLMHEHGADALLLTALENFPRVPGLQDQALAALANLMFHDEQTFRLTMESRDPSTLQNVIFSALRIFATHPSIVANALNLLINLCELGKSDNMKYLRKIATSSDTVRHIKPILDSQARTMECIQQVCLLIVSLSVVTEFQNSLRTAKVLDVLLSCLKQFAKKEPGKCESILDAINSAVAGNDESKRTFNHVGGVLALADLMTDVHSHETFQEKCCMVMDNISNGQFEATAEKMAHRKEAMKSVLASMTSFPGNAKVQEYGCSVMIKVAAIGPDDAIQLVDMGASPLVERARIAHKGILAVESLANQLLTLLVTNENSRNSRGQTTRGNASSRLRSRSRTIEKGGRSRSNMGHSKSPSKKRSQLPAVDENSGQNEDACDEASESETGESNTKERGSKTASSPEVRRSGLKSSDLTTTEPKDTRSTIAGNRGRSKPEDQRRPGPSETGKDSRELDRQNRPNRKSMEGSHSSADVK